ncbi:MAG: helix-turn-helix transcriptional regulator [Oscillospiraceae bacterium]|nr:helix-turn-helix transcriptional regulator [Oscillospiraceae bacterium]
MKLNEAVAHRIRELCKERGLTQYQLYLKTGVPQSTLSTIMKCSYPSMKLRIIYEICDGLEIDLKDFFASDMFNRENIED